MSPAGSDSATGTSAAPVKSVSRAAALATRGDVVEVQPGRYSETVELSLRQNGVTFRGVGESRAVIDGGRTRAFGFHNVGADDLTIQGFELTGQVQAGIYTKGNRALVSGNLVHHVGAQTEIHSNGIRIVQGRGNRVMDNTIHHIGPGSESMGIWLLQTRDAMVRGNSSYLVRKEGVRDWEGLDNTIVDNRLFLNWVGVSLNTSTGSTVTNNYVYDNVEGINVKHASYQNVLDYWSLAQGRWSRVLHNTVYRSTEASLWIGQSDQPLNYLDVRDNLFSAAGYAFVRDRPDLRGPDVTVDSNAYTDADQKPRYLYKAGWSSEPGLSSWADVRQQTSWEAAGGPSTLMLRDPAGGDLSLTQTATSAPGAQMASSGIPAAPAIWTPYRMVAVASSSPGTWWTSKHLQDSADNNQGSYWLTATPANEYAVYDFGRERTFNHLVLTIFTHNDKRNPRGYRFEVSDDREHWHTVKEGTNPNSAGSAYPYELSEPATGRYLRFTMVDTFCDSYAPRQGCGPYFVLSDLKAGLLSQHTVVQPTPDPVPERATPARLPARGPAAPRTDARPLEPRLAVVGRGVLTRHRRLRLTLSAVGGRGVAVVTVQAPGRGRKGGRAAAPILGRATVALRPGARQALEIVLGKSSLRRLRGLRRVSISIAAPGRRPTTSMVPILRN